MNRLEVTTYGMTHTGLRRKSNQDRFLIRRLPELLILAVADGVGGQQGGDVAAQCVVDTLAAHEFEIADPKETLVQVLSQAEAAMDCCCRANPKLEGMGTTLTLALVMEAQIHFLHVGDSRLYWIGRGEIFQMTTDQTFIQDLVDDGTISPDQARHHPLKDMLDQCVGMGDLEPELGMFEIRGPGCLMLCSDGLSGHLADEELMTIGAGMSLEDQAKELVNAALAAGGRDNITLILARFGEEK